MISKNRIKYIHSLELKKNRKAQGCFVAEGPKVVGDLLPLLTCTYLAATEEWWNKNMRVKHHLAPNTETDCVSQDELTKASFLKTPQEVLAIFQLPLEDECATQIPATQLCLALDDVQDPGNLGTIIRIADWFGIEHIFCSPGTADAFSPKTVQATMGAIGRVHLHYTALTEFLDSLPTGTPVYGTFLEGDNLYTTPIENRGVIVMGNEGKGISDNVHQRVTQALNIPNYPQGRATSESLNVAIATSVVCAEFRRRATAANPLPPIQ